MYGTPERTLPFQLFISTEFETRKLKWPSKRQISHLNDLLYRLNDLIRRLNEIVVVLISVLTFCFNFHSIIYRLNDIIGRLNDIISCLKDIFVVLNYFLSFFSFSSAEYRKKDPSRAP